MTPLGHAEAHERLADMALEPGAFERLGDPASDPLAAHVGTCDVCAREVAAWRRTQARLEVARGVGPGRLDMSDLAADEPVPLPPALRGTILDAVRASGGPVAREGRSVVAVTSPATTQRVSGRTSFRGPGRLSRRLLPLVAVLAVAVLGAGVIVDQSTRLDKIRRETALLQGAAASVDRILRDPDHRVVDLRSADGRTSGSLSWSSHDLVVLTTALEPPPEDRIYRCWLERDGKRWPVGVMWFAGQTAFWNGTLDEWATTSFEKGGTFGVSLEPLDGGTGNPAVLVAELPG
jgi:hypothetical protein